MLRGRPDSEKLDCRDDGPGWRRDPHSPQNFISAAIRQSARTAGESQGIRYTGWLAEALRMAVHASTRTTQLYDRREDGVTLDEVGGRVVEHCHSDRGTDLAVRVAVFPLLSGMASKEEDHLAECYRHIAEFKRRVSDQELRVAKLQHDGYPTADALDLLRNFRESLRLANRTGEFIRREMQGDLSRY